MIISLGRKYIFVHIPKTGGTALSLALEDRAMADDILIGDTPKAVKRRAKAKAWAGDRKLRKHSTLSDVDGLVAIEDFFVVTLVRNPWDRMVSYYHWLKDQSFDHRAVDLANAHDFSGFLNHPDTVASQTAETYGGYVSMSTKDVDVCFVRIENLAEDIRPFETHLGFKLDVPHVNRSRRNVDWHGYYNEADTALVGQMYAEDIRRFGYKF
ncbi:MAG: sulfotransferase family 2 domain-containing protein [Paracoccaceae bacterium]|nr:sulfotransferase family 2 domain-containing protein [Paracoccaceae bacterium]MDG1738342.1 sulfotransferase family 2 domain-containing protein [Paracoccaceae bacterium]MDG2258897.1 sulfotransferase family 2 domain-containing protein [Paracoccaceae bacterium]